MSYPFFYCIPQSAILGGEALNSRRNLQDQFKCKLSRKWVGIRVRTDTLDSVKMRFWGLTQDPVLRSVFLNQGLHAEDHSFLIQASVEIMNDV